MKSKSNGGLGELVLDNLSELVLGNWEGKGKEIYCEVDKTKIYKIEYKIKMNIKKINENVYRIKSKYYFSKCGKLFGLSYEKGDKAASDNILVTRTIDGFISSSLWNKKDSLSRTVDHFTFDENLSLRYNYSTNNIINPLNSYFQKLSSSLGRFVGMQTGKISVSGSYALTKVEDDDE